MPTLRPTNLTCEKCGRGLRYRTVTYGSGRAVITDVPSAECPNKVCSYALMLGADGRLDALAEEVAAFAAANPRRKIKVQYTDWPDSASPRP